MEKSTAKGFMVESFQLPGDCILDNFYMHLFFIEVALNVESMEN